MQLAHSFIVPTDPDEAFRLLHDIARVGPCLPGLTVSTVEGRQISGKLKVRIGPTQVTYHGSATVGGLDAATRSATVEVDGSEARGTGTAKATILLACTEVDEGTQVDLLTDLALTGRFEGVEAAVLAGVSDRLLRRFATALVDELAAAVPVAEVAEIAEGHTVGAQVDAAPDGLVPHTQVVGQRAMVLGTPAPRRTTPLVAVLAALVLVLWLLRRG